MRKIPSREKTDLSLRGSVAHPHLDPHDHIHLNPQLSCTITLSSTSSQPTTSTSTLIHPHTHSREQVIEMTAEQVDQLSNKQGLPPTDDKLKFVWDPIGAGEAHPSVLQAVMDVSKASPSLSIAGCSLRSCSTS